MLFQRLSLSILLFEILTFMSTEFSTGSLVIVSEQLNNLLLKLTFETAPLLLLPLFGIKSFPGAIILVLCSVTMLLQKHPFSKDHWKVTE